MLSPDWSLTLGAAGVFGAAAFTPGPNNAICAAISASQGWRGAMPFAFGVAVGFPVMLGIFGLGVGAVFSGVPELHWWARIVGALFLLRIAWRIATASGAREAEGEKRTPGFWDAVFFQWVNPKALAFAASLSAAYVRPEHTLADALTLAAMAAVITLPANGSWALAGAALGRALTTPKRMRIFNGAMGALLALSVAMLFV